MQLKASRGMVAGVLFLAGSGLAEAQISSGPWQSGLNTAFTQLTQWQRGPGGTTLKNLANQYKAQGILLDKNFRGIQAYLTGETPLCLNPSTPTRNYRWTEAHAVLDAAMTGGNDDAILYGWKMYFYYMADDFTATTNAANTCQTKAAALIQSKPNSPDGYLWSGACQVFGSTFDYALAKSRLSTAQAKGARADFVNLWLGLVEGRARYYTQALSALSGMASLGYVEGIYWRGRFAFDANQASVGCNDMDRVRSLAPSFWDHKIVESLLGACGMSYTPYNCVTGTVPCFPQCKNKTCGSSDGCGGTCPVGSGCN